MDSRPCDACLTAIRLAAGPTVTLHAECVRAIVGRLGAVDLELRRFEWMRHQDDEPWECPTCLQPHDEGHAPNCGLARALMRTPDADGSPGMR